VKSDLLSIWLVRENGKSTTKRFGQNPKNQKTISMLEAQQANANRG